MRDEVLRQLPPLPPGKSCHLPSCLLPSQALPTQNPALHLLEGKVPGGLCICLHLGPPAFAKPDPPWQGYCPSLPSLPGFLGTKLSRDPREADMQATGSLLPVPPSLPRWVAFLPQRLFTECPARQLISGMLDAGTSIISFFPHPPFPRQVVGTADC